MHLVVFEFIKKLRRYDTFRSGDRQIIYAKLDNVLTMTSCTPQKQHMWSTSILPSVSTTNQFKAISFLILEQTTCEWMFQFNVSCHNAQTWKWWIPIFCNEIIKRNSPLRFFISLETVLTNQSLQIFLYPIFMFYVNHFLTWHLVCNSNNK